MVAKRMEKTELTADEKRGFRLVLFSTGIDLLGLSLILPILPFLAVEFNASDFWVGVIFAIYAAAQTISVPIGGRLSDKYGRRPILLMSLMGSAIGFFLQGWANNLTFFLIARFAAGIFGATPPIAKAYIGDVVPAKQKKSYFGLLGGVIGFAFMIGPVVGSALAKVNLSMPMFVGSALSGTGFILALLFFKEPEKNKQGEIAVIEVADVEVVVELEEGITTGEDTSEGGAPKVLCPAPSEKKDDVKTGNEAPAARPKMLPYLYLSQFLNMSAFTGYLTLFALLTKTKFGWDQTEVGIMFSISSLVYIITQIKLFPWVAGKIGKHGSGIVGGLLSGVSFIVMPLIPSFEQSPDGTFISNPGSVIGITLPVLVMAVGFGLCTGTLPSLVSRYATPEKQGTAMGTAEMGDTIARIIMPLILAYTFQESGPILPFFICALCGILESIVLYSVLSANRRGYGLEIFVPTPKAGKAVLAEESSDEELRPTLAAEEAV